MRLIALVTLLCSAGPAPAMALCAALLAGDASLGRDDATCQTGQLLNGATQTTCHWMFPQQSDQAATRLEVLRTDIIHCLGEQSARAVEPGVNHPDTYAQQLFEGQGVRVSLSLKRKSALGQSLVFLAVSPAP